MEACEIISGGLLVAGCDGAELFDKIEETLYQIALGVEREVAIAFDLAV